MTTNYENKVSYYSNDELVADLKKAGLCDAEKTALQAEASRRFQQAMNAELLDGNSTYGYELNSELK